MKKQIEQEFDLMLDLLTKLVSYKTIKQEACAQAIFGKPLAEALQYILDYGERIGLKTGNLANYCGYIEYGSGEKVIGILTHLDVVPAGDGWSSDPFTLTIRDGKAYGRGTTDDKGAIVSSLIALKLLLDNNIKVNQRIRLIIGCNEESGSLGIKHYLKQEGKINVGFTPDAKFPGIHAEKGLIHGSINLKTTKIKDITAQDAINKVPSFCQTTFRQQEANLVYLKEYLAKNHIKYELLSNQEEITLKVYGVAAHASHPEKGVNAISYSLSALAYAGLHDELLDFYDRFIQTTYNGELIQLNLSDQYSFLTLNIATICQKGNEVELQYDLRFPVTASSKQIVKQLKKYGFKVRSIHEPLFYPPNHPLVTILEDVYADVMKQRLSMRCTGGGTYAKEMPNCLAFGGGFEGTDYRIHQTDEFLDLEQWKDQTNIIYQAIIALSNALKQNKF